MSDAAFGVEINDTETKELLYKSLAMIPKSNKKHGIAQPSQRQNRF
jgi:hypothetical protein